MTAATVHTDTSSRRLSVVPEPQRARAVIYARISEDTRRDAHGVEGQIERCAAMAAQRGLTLVVDAIDDNDREAHTGRARPGYERLMSLAKSGEVDTIIVDASSRLWRNRRERAEGHETLRAAHVNVLPVRGPELEFGTAAGRLMADVFGAADAWESEIKSERVAAEAARRAEQGRANGPAGYGFRHEYEADPKTGKPRWVKTVAEDAEAEIVREVIGRLAAGGPGNSLAAITVDLNRRGVPAPGARFTFTKKERAEINADGRRWSPTSVRKLALRASNAGLRVIHAGQPDERTIKAAWPALVPMDQWEAVCDELTRTTRDQRRTRPAARQHLLTWGVGYCGVCGGFLRVATRGGNRLYVCAEQNTLGNDGKPKSCTGRREDRVDELVRAVVVDRLSRPDAVDLLADDGRDLAEAEARVASLKAKLDDAAERFASDVWTADQVDRVNSTLLPKLADAEAEVRRLKRAAEPRVLTEWVGPEVAARWDAADVFRRRALLEALELRVSLLPTRRGPGFDPDSVVISYGGDR